MEDDTRRSEPADGIDLDDGTWVDVGSDGRWRPSLGERVRGAVLLVIFLVVLGSVVLLASLGDSAADDEVATDESATTTTEAPSTTTTTTTPPDASSIGGEPASERCSDDDRGAEPLRDRAETTILVLNGTPRTGHAGANTDELDLMGYDTVAPDNESIRDLTSVHYRLGFCAEGERLAEEFGYPDAEVAPVPRNLPVTVGRAELVLVLGRDSL